MATINDISKLTGFSPATISRVLNADKNISVKEDTKIAIFNAAKELGYKVKKKDTEVDYLIGVIQWISANSEIDDPYYYSLRLSVENSLLRENMHIKRYYKEDMEEIFNNKNLNGLVCLGKFSENQAKNLRETFDKLLFVDYNPNENIYHSILSDLESATKDVVEYLKYLGHRKIGFIGGRERKGSRSNLFIDIREKTYDKIMEKDLSLISDSRFKKIRDFDGETGYDLMKIMLKEDDCPRAFICANDSIAIGALRAIGEKNLRGDKRISIVGFNDIAMAKFTNPPLTTVKINIKQMGDLSGTLMKYLIYNQVESPINLICKTKLMIRESTFKV